ncbi:hypothetical protein [Microcoleus phage My-WqHQDG]|nr:hypothetical protein [Microcoleus phage My-WqHQDG]
MNKKYISLALAKELDDDRLAAANAIRYWRDIKPTLSTPREALSDELVYSLGTVNNYQAKLCALLGITVQQEAELTMYSGALVIKEPVLGMSTSSITLHYYYSNGYLPYKLWMKEGGTVLGIEAYSTQDLIARMHNACCVMQMFSENRPLIE